MMDKDYSKATKQELIESLEVAHKRIQTLEVENKLRKKLLKDYEESYIVLSTKYVNLLDTVQAIEKRTGKLLEKERGV